MGLSGECCGGLPSMLVVDGLGSGSYFARSSPPSVCCRIDALSSQRRARVWELRTSGPKTSEPRRKCLEARGKRLQNGLATTVQRSPPQSGKVLRCVGSMRHTFGTSDGHKRRDAHHFCNKPACAPEAVVERQNVGTVPPSPTRLTICLMRCVDCVKKPQGVPKRDEPMTR